jgi:hypothetical protein
MGIKGRELEQHLLYVPGPGQYQPDIQTLKQHHPTIKIGSEMRMPKEKTTIKDVPGPGNYNPKKRPTSAAPAYGFGSGIRRNAGNTSDKTPGPGTYKLPSRI